MSLWLHRLIKAVRQMSGDDAYERYLHHWRLYHAQDGAPPDRKTFFKSEQQRKWNGIRRCC